MRAEHSTPPVLLGVDLLLRDFSLVKGHRWGLITNNTGVTSELQLSSVALWKAGAPLVALLAPEHGVRGTAQAGDSEAGGVDPETHLPVLDTYLKDGPELDQAIAELGLDALLFDLQDIGARFYTYASTMIDCMRSAARLGIPFHVLDRPNPLGGEKVAGPGIVTGFESFVGRMDIPIRHGLTVGELARVGASLDRRNGVDVPDPGVVMMQGWHRWMLWDDTGLSWVMPSPNIPTPESAMAFVGTALFEGTSMSEGRGTTRPFELVGAPWLDSGYADLLTQARLPGVRFRTAWFSPTFSKHAHQAIGGVQIHIADPDIYDPLRSAVDMIMVAMSAPNADFQWREPAWEETGPRPLFIDLLWGSDSLRNRIDDGDKAAILAEIDSAQDLRSRDEHLLLYGSDL
ncbi:MAG: exo-beta-N-acetylmuramidase NamZ family protein [Arachnia sp.]